MRKRQSRKLLFSDFRENVNKHKIKPHVREVTKTCLSKGTGSAFRLRKLESICWRTVSQSHDIATKNKQKQKQIDIIKRATHIMSCGLRLRFARPRPRLMIMLLSFVPSCFIPGTYHRNCHITTHITNQVCVYIYIYIYNHLTTNHRNHHIHN